MIQPSAATICVYDLPASQVHRVRAAVAFCVAGRARSAATDSGPDIVLRLPDWRRWRARALSEGARVFPAHRRAVGSRQLRGTGQDDDGKLLRAGDDQRAGEPEAARSAGRDQQAARGSPRPQTTPKRRSSPPRDGRSTSSTRRFTRRRSPTARRSSTSSIVSRRRTHRLSDRCWRGQSCCSCRRRIPTASTW